MFNVWFKNHIFLFFQNLCSLNLSFNLNEYFFAKNKKYLYNDNTQKFILYKKFFLINIKNKN